MIGADDAVDGSLRLASRRVLLDPAPRPAAGVPFAAMFVGHCPGRVRPERMRQVLRDRLLELGFGRLFAPPSLPDASDDERQALRQLPLEITSVAQLYDLFPDADQSATAYASELAGATAWLPRAVEDFFTAGGKRAVVVVVGEDEAQDAFAPPTVALDRFAPPWEQRGLSLLRLLPDVALVAMPDLERLQVPADLPDPELPAPDRPKAVFAACGDPPLQTEPNSISPGPQPAPRDTEQLVRPVLRFLARERPDVQCLYTLPLASRHRRGPLGGQADAAPLRLDEEQAAPLAELKGHPDAERRLLQPLFPYLRGPRYTLGSPAGLVAGTIARVYREQGAWVSMAGRPLVTDARPLPALSIRRAADLRQIFSVGVLVPLGGRVELDDERCPSDQFALSAEAVRFWGFLRRQLERLGQQLVFRSSPEDPVPQILLRQFLTDLHARGALQGRSSEEAFSVRPVAAPPGGLALEIALALTFPIDTLRLTFVNSEGRWSVQPRLEVPGG